MNSRRVLCHFDFAKVKIDGEEGIIRSAQHVSEVVDAAVKSVIAGAVGRQFHCVVKSDVGQTFGAEAGGNRCLIEGAGQDMIPRSQVDGWNAFLSRQTLQAIEDGAVVEDGSFQRVGILEG